jgi:ABC-2 type transport system ATP-binding protein
MSAKQPKSSLSASEAIININHFKMDFGSKNVIKDLSFDVYKGEVFGFLGSNGSGKTTTIRALLGIYKPTSGTLNIGGKPFSIPSSIKLGYLPEERGFYRKETVIDVMTYFGQLKGLSKTDAKAKAENYLRRVKLIDMASVRIDKLSGGQQQKIQLGITIMDDPMLLILDEPTKGFDPVNRRLLMDIVQEHRQAGATVIFVTHQMEEVEQLCDRIILLKDGTARAYGTVADVKREFGNLSLDDIFIKVYGDENEQTERGDNV